MLLASQRQHYLWCDQHHIDVLPELNAVVLQDAQQEAVRQAQRRARLHGRQQPRVQLGLRRAMPGGIWCGLHAFWHFAVLARP